MTEPAKSTTASQPRGTETILVVDDEATLRAAAVRMLGRFGYTAISAGSGEEAMEVLRRDVPRFHLVLTDLQMPGMSGADLIASIKTVYGNLPVVLVSGSDEADERRRLGLELAVPYLEKPWTLTQLLTTVRGAIDARIRQS